MKLAIRTLVAVCALLATAANAQIFRELPPPASGVTWVHVNAHSPKRYLPETIHPGVAIFDYNNDGWMDLLFVNSGTSPFYKPAQPPSHALYRNNKNGTFTDVTSAAGITADFFAMGVAAADYDADGDQDVFLTGYGKSVLYQNDGRGKFTDVTAASGIAAPGWSTSAAWFDYNNDGRLDLFVTQFVDYSSLRSCDSASAYGGKQDKAQAAQTFYCIPRVFPPMPNHFYRNDSGGRFTDVSRETGISKSLGKGFGVVAVDVDRDGWQDVFVANDTVPNFLFMNRRGKRFDEVGLDAGVAYSDTGIARSGMGVDAADVTGDGWPDLFVANVDQEMFSLYRNDKNETFTDVARTHGIAAPTRLLSGWGLKFFDYDNDGALDLILANGHPDDLVDQRMRGVTHKEPLLLFRNDGTGKMRNVSATAGEAFTRDYNARGLAVGDLDNDGDLDVVVGINGGAPLLLFNAGTKQHHWVGLELVSTRTNPSAVGSIIKWSVNGVVHSRMKTAGGSFMSSHDPREVIGLGTAKLDWIEVHWPAPSKQIDRITAPAVDRYLRIQEGDAAPPRRP